MVCAAGGEGKSGMEPRAKEMLLTWREPGGADELRAVAEYVAGLEAEIGRLRGVVEGVDYELSKALDGTGFSDTVERIRRVLRDARPVPRPSD